MSPNNALQRAQVYRFLADAFLYPKDNWLDDFTCLMPVLRRLEMEDPIAALWAPGATAVTVEQLQATHRRTFGLAGSLCYETEYGLPGEYRQSQEMADIAGFYRAFGFQLGGARRERPDHIATELEFMHILTLKEFLAVSQDLDKQAEICADAQRTFLEDHLARWIGWFAQSLARQAPEAIYVSLAQMADLFVATDADRLGASPQAPPLTKIQHTPFDPDFSCAECCPLNGGPP